MPRYVYKCSECEGSFTTFHGINDDQDYCELCLATNCVRRIPQIPSVKHKTNVGNVVKEYINDAKDELSKEKKRLASEERD